jgi:SPOR domain
MMRAGSPRPTLTIVAIATVLGIAVGTGIAFMAGGRAEGGDQPPAAAPAATTTTQLREFYTVVLASIPSEDGDSQAAADQRVGALEEQGIEVGVLDSSEFSSLNPGYLVVYSGRFPTEDAADAHLDELSDKDLPGGQDPYVRAVKP